MEILLLTIGVLSGVIFIESLILKIFIRKSLREIVEDIFHILIP